MAALLALFSKPDTGTFTHAIIETTIVVQHAAAEQLALQGLAKSVGECRRVPGVLAEANVVDSP
jgi:hypothetical protein